MAKKNETVEQKMTAKPVASIYIGPSFRGVASGTVFINGLAPALGEAIKKVPAIAELVIPVAGIVSANKELSDPGSALSSCYLAAAEYKKGE